MKPPATSQRAPTHIAAATPLPHPEALPVPNGAICRLEVSCPLRIRPQRMYRCEVRAELHSYSPVARPPGLGPLVVRLFVPGCLVTPGEIALDLAQGESTTGTFTLVSFAVGTIDARFDVIRNGQTCLQLPVRSRSVSRGPVAWLACAAVLAPWLWWTLVQASATNAGAVATTLNRLLPSWCSRWLAEPVQRALAVAVSLEELFCVGFWLAASLVIATALAAWKCRGGGRVRIGGPLILEVGPPPSARSRPLPPYLTPVTREEMNPIDR